MSIRLNLAGIAGAAVLSLAALTVSAIASDIKLGDLVISKPFTRATVPAARVGGGFLTITNTGDTPDRLISVSAPFAAKSEIHEMKVENNVMKMRPVEGGIEVPAGGSVELKPGGYHLMFMKLAEQLKEGENRIVTLVFEKAGSVDVDFKVGSVGAKQSPDS